MEERQEISWEEAYADWTPEMRQERRNYLKVVEGSIRHVRGWCIAAFWICGATAIWDGYCFVMYDSIFFFIMCLLLFGCAMYNHKSLSDHRTKLRSIEAQLIELDRRDALDSQ